MNGTQQYGKVGITLTQPKNCISCYVHDELLNT